MVQPKAVLLLGLSLLLLSGGLVAHTVYAIGTTVTVNQTGDLSDQNPGDGICDVAVDAGDQCSLRAAIEELNALGTDTTPHRIVFNIPGNGPHTIAPATGLPFITAPLIIDGTTQPGTSCPTASAPANLQIVLDGSNAGSGANGLYFFLNRDGNVVRGLVIGNFDQVGISLLGSDNSISCNHIGVQADGISPMGNGRGIFVGGERNVIGGNAPARRNVISANNGTGIELAGEAHRVAGNFIGTTADGMGALGNEDGFLVAGDAMTIGGTERLARNVISGNNRNGVRLYDSSQNTISGNYIGVARDGSMPLPNEWNGVAIYAASSSNLVGDTQADGGNSIAYNGENGVLVNDSGDSPQETSILYNSIHSNGGMGIDLGADGVDTNDPGDADEGENGRQNYPVLVTTPGSLTVGGMLDSRANTAYTIDVYRNSSCDPSGHGEGQQYLTSLTVTTDSTGDAGFDVTLAGVASGDSITATATDPDGNTSEFSACVTLSQLPPTATPTTASEATPTATVPPATTPTATNDPEQAPEYVVWLPLIVK